MSNHRLLLRIMPTLGPLLVVIMVVTSGYAVWYASNPVVHETTTRQENSHLIAGVNKDLQGQKYNRTALSQAITKMLVSQVKTRTGSTPTTVSYAPPCSTAVNVADSTASLLVATALTKADNETLQELDLFQFFEGLFAVPSSGFIPRYSYPIEPDAQLSRYIPRTRIPNWPFFRNRTDASWPACPNGQTSCWVGSGRISAIPFHATILLELVRHLERQRKPHHEVHENQIQQLHGYWNRIYDNHAYRHDVVMRGCVNNETGTTPCYNTIHPWESLLAAPSFWKDDQALAPTLHRMKQLGWKVPFSVPDLVQHSHDYDEEAYAAMTFLIECHANHTATGVHANHHTSQHYPYQYATDPSDHEEQLLNKCPFAMLDVGVAAALAQADDDLYQVAQWLSAQQGITFSSSWRTKLARFKAWEQQNTFVWDQLWNPEYQSFQSRYAVLSDAPEPTNTMQFFQATTANNLMVFWKDWSDELQSSMRTTQALSGDDDAQEQQHLRRMALQLLQHQGKNSFDCSEAGDSYPLWSAGCEDNTPANFIDPRWNYFVGVGLARNQEHIPAFGSYLTNATIDLVCTQDRSQSPAVEAPLDCAHHLSRFPEAFTVNSSYDLGLDECGRTSMSTASILLHLLKNDFDFDLETPIPPIRNSWVITLITLELMIAFAVGASCVALSLSLIQKENNRSNLDFAEEPGPDYVAIPIDGGTEEPSPADSNVVETEQDIE